PLVHPCPEGAEERPTATSRPRIRALHAYQGSRPSSPPHAPMPPCLDAFFFVICPNQPHHTSGATAPRATAPARALPQLHHATPRPAPSLHRPGMEVPEEGVLPFLRHQRTQPPSRLATPGPPHAPAQPPKPNRDRQGADGADQFTGTRILRSADATRQHPQPPPRRGEGL